MLSMDQLTLKNLTKQYFQVFFPINIKQNHWYLAVVNAHHRVIQVLDSKGPAKSRPELDELVGKYSSMHFQNHKLLLLLPWPLIIIFMSVARVAKPFEPPSRPKFDPRTQVEGFTCQKMGSP